MTESKRMRFVHAQRYLFTGVLTVIPIWISWLVFEFFFKQLSKFSMPWVRAFAKVVRE